MRRTATRRAAARFAVTLPAAALGIGLLAAGPAAPAKAAAEGCVESEGIVCTDAGPVRGTLEGGTLAFKGIPYARPPVGPLRWRPPAAPEPWMEVRDASRYGEVCPQLTGSGQPVGDEDCLTVNVWKPAAPASTAAATAATAATAAEQRPVMVWFTGGGNHSLSGQGSAQYGGVSYDGRALAERAGVVFVSFNYRLGALGFLTHPALGAEGPEKVSGNYGTQDQIALLGWVRRNIARFGGDPQRVMLFGTSAGGANICALMTAPAAAGLFQAAAMHSSVPTGCELPTLKEAEASTGARVAAALGCEGGEAGACLRGKSMAEVVRAVPGTFGVFPRLYGPVVDGRVLPGQPIARIRAGRHQPVPVLLGNSAEETMQFVDAAGPVTDGASYAAAVEKVFGSAARDRILARYPESAYPSARRAFVQATTDALFTCRTLAVARTLAAHQKEPVFRSLFAHPLENDPALKALGINHTIEHPFFFAWSGSYRPTAADRAVQAVMLDGWSNLARAGNPNGGAMPPWPAVTPANPGARLLIGPAGAAADPGTDLEICRFWEGIRLPRPHL
ncbi:carboxylesterase/lipase family protein [Azospirillum thermophilum]|uniref:Carboxylic ester hydrolase n=1 Tax=Azospirillum thermophilum TaxID=2202148 RepID=A0A2S2D042_9PROT|nr:carboxylesterase family protein [Azospirillum thermophilum]AWK90068.1 hypothetical protein DEW08_29215 [Azospirillum thermophilum]